MFSCFQILLLFSSMIMIVLYSSTIILLSLQYLFIGNVEYLTISPSSCTSQSLYFLKFKFLNSKTSNLYPLRFFVLFLYYIWFVPVLKRWVQEETDVFCYFQIFICKWDSYFIRFKYSLAFSYFIHFKYSLAFLFALSSLFPVSYLFLLLTTIYNSDNSKCNRIPKPWLRH